MLSFEMDDCIIVWYKETGELVVTTNEIDLQLIINCIKSVYNVSSFEEMASGVCFQIEGDVDTDELCHIFEIIDLPFDEKRKELLLILASCDEKQRKELKDAVNGKITGNVQDAGVSQQPDIQENGNNKGVPDDGNEPDRGAARESGDRPF